MDGKKKEATIVGQSRILRKGDWGLGWDWHGDQSVRTELIYSKKLVRGSVREEESRPIGEEMVSKLCGQVSAFSERDSSKPIKKECRDCLSQTACFKLL
jgi:hypothetical protein